MTPREADDDDLPDDVLESASEPAAPTRETPARAAGATPQDQALAALDPDLRADTVRRAAEYGVLHTDDPLWTIIRAVTESAAASKSASEAAEATRKAVARLDDAPARIERAALDGASRAASDIQQHAAAGAETIASTLGKQIEAAAAGPIGKVMRPHLTMLDERAQNIRDELKNRVNQQVTTLINEFLRNANKYVRSHSISTKTAGRMSALLLLIVGAVLGVAGTKLDHRLSPTPIHSTASGGYTVRVPQGDGGRFEKCGSRECVYLYPPRRAQSNHK